MSDAAERVSYIEDAVRRALNPSGRPVPWNLEVGELPGYGRVEVTLSSGERLGRRGVGIVSQVGAGALVSAEGDRFELVKFEGPLKGSVAYKTGCLAGSRPDSFRLALGLDPRTARALTYPLNDPKIGLAEIVGANCRIAGRNTLFGSTIGVAGETSYCFDLPLTPSLMNNPVNRVVALLRLAGDGIVGGIDELTAYSLKFKFVDLCPVILLAVSAAYCCRIAYLSYGEGNGSGAGLPGKLVTDV